jgi:hypothetical protein
VQFRRDLFDNCFARCFYPERVQDLEFDLSVEIELHEYNAFHFLLDNYASQYPFIYPRSDLAKLAHYLTAAPHAMDDDVKLLPLPFWKLPAEPCSTVSMVVDLVQAMHQNIGYEAREEGAARSPAETIRLGHGACRDTAVLLAAVLREMGLASRLVSGYLCELDVESKDRRSVGAMHLWTEVYLPGAGWTGLDPTNGNFCNHNFIATAVGLTAAEVTPISGSYFDKEFVPANMTATLELSLCGPTAPKIAMRASTDGDID